MLYDYVFYQNDESFDFYGPFGTDTWYEMTNQGFQIDIDINNKVDMNKFHAYGDFEEMNHLCKTTDDLKKYIIEHFNEIQGLEDTEESENIAIFKEFIDILSEQKQAA